MPATDPSSGKAYFHVYNCGVEKRDIFKDAHDYETFQGYLAGYLNPPADPESVKKVFTVHGRTFKGTPHQPKNHFGKIELLGYSLMPNHFHLVLQQSNHGHLESFIRSLCTRYSMYFNKKYNRKGSLFEGPYKSVRIEEKSKLLSLINFVHHGANDFSSYPEYTDKRDTSWVNTNIVPSGDIALSDSDNDSLKGLTFEDDIQAPEKKEVAVKDEKTVRPASRMPEFAGIVAVFLLLLGLGFRNVKIATAQKLAAAPTQSPSVLAESVEPRDPSEPKITVVVKISGDVDHINIRKSPSITSEKVAQAKNGDEFEFVSVNSGWYEVKLTDGATGFISSEFSYIQDAEIQQ